MNDTVDRQAAIQTAERMYKRCDTGSIEDYHDLMIEALTALPSAQPERDYTIGLLHDNSTVIWQPLPKCYREED